MKIAALKRTSLHVLLFPLFFSLHKLNEYFGLIGATYFLILLAYCFTISLILFFSGRLLLKNHIKAGYWTAILLLIYFFFGYAQDLLRAAPLPVFFKSYTFLLPLILVLATGFTVYVRRKKTIPVKTTAFLNLVFGLFVVLELAGLGYKALTHQTAQNNLAYKNTPLPINLANSQPNALPDIFFIVFDEYASSAALKKYLRFDNSSLDSLLRREHFYISTASRSNYNSTPHSLASTLNLDYFNLPLENELTRPKVLMKGEVSFVNSLLPRLLADRGYQVLNYGYFDLADQAAPSETYFSLAAIDNLLHETLWGRIKKEIWWNVVVRFPFLTKKQMNKAADELARRNRSNWQAVLQEMRKQDGSPKFVYAHMMMPHADFNYDRLGRRREPTLLDFEDAIRDSLYIDQLIYTNTWIDSLVRAANLEFARPRAIIIEGDHGYRGLHYTTERLKTRDREFMNLNTYYFSDGDYGPLYDSISPVNSFRVILNKYFNTRLPLLKDSTVFLY